MLRKTLSIILPLLYVLAVLVNYTVIFVLRFYTDAVKEKMPTSYYGGYFGEFVFGTSFFLSVLAFPFIAWKVTRRESPLFWVIGMLVAGLPWVYAFIMYFFVNGVS